VRILLTGASGFVGRYVKAAIPGCLPLTEAGKSVDLRDAPHVDSVVRALQPEAVIHLAAQSSVAHSFCSPRETYEVNFLGLLNLLESLKRSCFTGRFLFVGSGDVYGLVPEADLPVTEEYPLRPRSPYAVSKVAAEALCFQWSQVADFEIVMARPFNHCGPGQSDRFVIASLAGQIRKIKRSLVPPILYAGDLDVSRDFTDVRDVVRAYGLLLQQGRNGRIYNVCSGTQHAIRDLLATMLNVAGMQVRIVDDRKHFRESEQRNMRGDPRRIKEEIGWQPAISITQSLTDVLNEEENTRE
jgi:GDP-4-dehydro-6-deoxy-D-mannose reductase